MSRLTQIIALLYEMAPSDVSQLEGQLLEQRKAAWDTALREKATEYGCSGTPNPPSGADLQELKAMSHEDAQSIADTWNREVENQVERLYAADKYGSRYYYADRMDAWARDRGVWKNAQIAIQTEMTTRAYAVNRFLAMNGLRGGKFLFKGPPAVCEVCINEFAMGLVSQAYVDSHPCPRHIGCPHTWEEAKIRDLPCDEMWLG